MEDKARLINVSRDWATGRFRLLFELAGDISDAVDEITDKDLRLKAIRWREKRSLDANAYFWVLCTAIAGKLGTSKQEVYELMLRRYGQISVDGEGAAEWRILPEGQEPKEDEHLLPTDKFVLLKKKAGQIKGRVYIVLKGSSEYDSEEMSKLIDGTIEEAKSLGIDTMTPAEREELISKWRSR